MTGVDSLVKEAQCLIKKTFSSYDEGSFIDIKVFAVPLMQDIMQKATFGNEDNPTRAYFTLTVL